MSIGTVGTPQASIAVAQPAEDGAEVYSDDVLLANPQSADGQAVAVREMQLRNSVGAAQANISQQLGGFSDRMAMMMASQTVAPSADGERMRALLGGEPSYQATSGFSTLSNMPSGGNIDFGFVADAPPPPANAELLNFLNQNGDFESLDGKTKRETLSKYAQEKGFKIYPETILNDGSIEHLTQEQALLLLCDDVTKNAVTAKNAITTESYKMGENYSEDAFRSYMMQFPTEKHPEVLKNTLNNLFMDMAPDDIFTSDEKNNEYQKRSEKAIQHIMNVYDGGKGFNNVVGEIFDRQANVINGKESGLYTKEKMQETLESLRKKVND